MAPGDPATVKSLHVLYWKGKHKLVILPVSCSDLGLWKEVKGSVTSSPRKPMMLVRPTQDCWGLSIARELSWSRNLIFFSVFKLDWNDNSICVLEKPSNNRTHTHRAKPWSGLIKLGVIISEVSRERASGSAGDQRPFFPQGCPSGGCFCIALSWVQRAVCFVSLVWLSFR